jgi:hypothetical protein
MPGPESYNFPVLEGKATDVNLETPRSAVIGETSRYDVNYYVPIGGLTAEEVQGTRAANQGFGMELATAGANLIPNIVLSMVETTAQLADIEDWSNMIQGNAANYGNALTEWASRNKNKFGEVYQKTPGENNIFDSAWWVSNGAGLVESLVAYGLTGYGVGNTFMKGANSLSKVLGAYGKVKTGIELSAQLGTSGVLAFTEGAMTGGQVFKDVYTDSYNSKLEELLRQGAEQYGEDNLTEAYQKYAKTAADQFANQVAGEAATTAVRTNTLVNTFLNMPETSVLFRSMSASRYLDDALKLERGELAKDAVERIKSFDVNKHLTKQAVANKVKETGSEMLEEMVNVYAEQEGKNVGREATGQDVMTLGDMLADDDIWAAGFWGAIGGSMNGFVMGKMPKWVTQEDGTKKRTTVGAYTKEQVAGKYQEQLTDLQDRLTEFVDARDAMVKASKSGDERAYKEAADKVFSYNSFNSIVKGTEEQLLNDFQNILGMTAEEATQQGFASDYKERAAEKIQSIRENTKEWNRLQDKYASQDLDQAGFPETVFQQHVNVQNNRKIIQENKLELAKLESEIAQSYSLRGTDLTTAFFNDIESSIKAVEHAFEMATIDLENILNLDSFNSKTQKRIIAKLSNMYGNLATAKQEIEKQLQELKDQRDDLISTSEIQKANFYFTIDPDNLMSEEDKFNKYRNVIIQNTVDIQALTEGKKTLETNKKILASQEEELRVLKSDKGLERFKELKKEKMAEREAIDVKAAAKATEQAEAQAKAEKVAAAKAKKKAAPETVTVQEEEIIEAATPVESFEEGNYAGEGSTPDEFKEQFKGISEVADNSDIEGQVIDSSDEEIAVGDRLIAGSNKLAYASTVEYVEEGGTLKHTSLKLNPETNPDLLTDKYVPGTKLKIKKLTAEEFKPFIATKEIKFIDELGREILVANEGVTVTFAMLDHPYMQPIGIYNEAGEYQAMLHATSYINADRIVPANVADDLQTLINIRAAVTDQFQEVTIDSKSNGKINKLPQFYRLSELIDEPIEFAIATSSIQLNTSKTTPVENLANKKGFKVGQVYAITVMPDGRKIAIPVKTTKVKESPQVLTELMSALNAFLKGGSREDLANVFSQYLHSTFSSDKLTSDGNAFEEDPNGKDRFYIDYTSKNVKGIIFGRAGGSKNFISGDSPADSMEVFKKALASIIEESYININFESLKNPDFVKQYVTSDVRFYPLPNGKVTIFDNPVIGFDTSNLLNATAPAAKVTPTPATVVTPTSQPKTIEEIKNDIAEFRAQEQAEYAAMSDPNDTVEKNRIYTVYDKIITPLIKEAEADIEARKEKALKEQTEDEWNNEIGWFINDNLDNSKGFVGYYNGEESESFTTKEELFKWLSSKYKAELDAVKQPQPTPVAKTPIIDVKTDIEKRRQEELDNLPKGIVDLDAEFDINSKYDAELEAIKEVKPTTTNVSSLDNSLEERVEKIKERGLDRLFPIEIDETTRDGKELLKQKQDQEKAIAELDLELAALESQPSTVETPIVEITPTEPITLTSASGIEFDIEIDEDDYSITTAEEIEKSVSLQDKVNTLIAEGKATKFCK